jgi:hypothetical protein
MDNPKIVWSYKKLQSLFEQKKKTKLEMLHYLTSDYVTKLYDQNRTVLA